VPGVHLLLRERAGRVVAQANRHPDLVELDHFARDIEQPGGQAGDFVDIAALAPGQLGCSVDLDARVQSALASSTSREHGP